MRQTGMLVKTIQLYSMHINDTTSNITFGIYSKLSYEQNEISLTDRAFTYL